MRTRRWIPFALVVIASVSAPHGLAADAEAEALKRRVLDHARTVSADDYSFTRTVRSTRVEGEKRTERTEVERFDPSNAAHRWTLVSIDGRPPNAEELQRHAKSSPKRRVAHYGRVADYFAMPATATKDAQGRTVFRFSSLPPETVVVTNVDISASAICEATVNTNGPMPFVEQARFTLTKPVRVKVVAKLQKFEATSRYRVMPDGKPVPIEHVSNAYGSLLGSEGSIRSVLTYTDHRPVRR
jgi:hypothetical protein